MQHGGKADHRSGAPNLMAHGILRFVGIADNRGERTVITDGACQDIGDTHLFARTNDAVVKVFALDKLRDGAIETAAVNSVQMIVVTTGLALLSVDVCAQSRAQIGTPLNHG